MTLGGSAERTVAFSWVLGGGPYPYVAGDDQGVRGVGDRVFP